MIKAITQGRYTANISANGTDFMVMVTRDGDCLHGIHCRYYADMKRAETGAKRLIKKAGG